jgi:hypothetical protein
MCYDHVIERKRYRAAFPIDVVHLVTGQLGLMNLNSIRSCPGGYIPAPIPERLCSHADLAMLLLHYLDHEPPAFRPPVSDEGIRNVVELAFFASMAPEEGRYLRFNISCQKDVGAPFTVTRFDPIPLKSVDALRRLAPSCTHSECALLVTERDEGICCDGVINIGPIGSDTMPGRPEFTSGGGRPSIQIAVIGPGHMIARCGVMAYELREGKIRHVSDYWNVPAVKTFREELAEQLEQELVQRMGEDATTLFGGSKGSLPIHVILSTILRVAVDGNHGGAFVIIPSDSCECEPFDIHLKYVASELDLSAHMIEFWCACAEAAHKQLQDGYTNAIRSWTRRKAIMLLAAEAVGNLSCIDGCVVLNRRLQLCGFGGEIKVSDQAAKEAPRNFTDYKTGEEWEYEVFLRGIGGTRHKSAARLCKAHDGILVFIASQDGQFKVFSSNEDKVNAFGPLDVTRAPVGMG